MSKTIEKVGDYKKDMKAFVKGCVKSKLFQDEAGNLTVTIEKNFDKETNTRTASLIVASPCDTFTSIFKAEVATRVYNKIDPTLFEALGEQLAKTKNFGKLIVK